MSENIFFTSDEHHGHKNVIKYDNRPFENVYEMTEVLIENNNEMVKPNDKVYHIGDFSWHGPGKTIEIIKRLNGKHHFIMGNHDKVLLKPAVQEYAEWVKYYHELTIQDPTLKHKKILMVLSHYAMVVWNKSHYGSIMAHGHSHGNLDEYNIRCNVRRIDACVSSHNYFPWNYEEIRDTLQDRGVKFHHE